MDGVAGKHHFTVGLHECALTAAQLREYKRAYTVGSKLGGEHFNVLKVSGEERASHSFEEKDPLAEFPVKDLREGNLGLAPT